MKSKLKVEYYPTIGKNFLNAAIEIVKKTINDVERSPVGFKPK